MRCDLDSLYLNAKRELETICEEEKKLQVKKSDLGKVIEYLEKEIRKKTALFKADPPPADDLEVTVPAKRNKVAFMIRICASFGRKFSVTDVINKLKSEYPNFDHSSIPWYLQELVSRKLIAYDGLQYALAEERQYRKRGFNVARAIKEVVFEGLNGDSLAFNVSRVYDLAVEKHPDAGIDRQIVSSTLCRLEKDGKLTSTPGIHSRAAKIYSLK